MIQDFLIPFLIHFEIPNFNSLYYIPLKLEQLALCGFTAVICDHFGRRIVNYLDLLIPNFVHDKKVTNVYVFTTLSV